MILNLSAWTKPTNPLFAFLLPWSFVLLGMQFPLCKLIISKFSPMYWVILGNIITAIVFFFFTSLTLKPRSEFQISKQFEKITLLTILFVLIVQAFQFIYFKGFPLLWLILGDSRCYVDYGIKSLNGLINALFLISTTSLYLITLSKKKYRTLLLLLLCLPIALVSRQLLTSLFLQIACCHLMLRPKSLKYIFAFFLLALTLFLLLGNYRTGLTQLTKILQPEPFVPEFLYSFLWIYAYLVTPFNNINSAVELIEPLDAPVNELKMAIPSVLHSFFHLEGDSAGFELVHENMNVSTFYLPLIQDFGLTYAFLFMAAVQFILCLAYRKAYNRGHQIDIMQYSILYTIVVLSFFSNLLLFLPIIFQLIFTYLIQLGMRRKNGVLCLEIT